MSVMNIYHFATNTKGSIQNVQNALKFTYFYRTVE